MYAISLLLTYCLIMMTHLAGLFQTLHPSAIVSKYVI